MLKLDTGKLGLQTCTETRLQGKQKLECELTVRAGKVVYDLNGISRPDWENYPRTICRPAVQSDT